MTFDVVGRASPPLGNDGGRLLTEMSDAELMEFVALDLARATGDARGTSEATSDTVR